MSAHLYAPGVAQKKPDSKLSAFVRDSDKVQTDGEAAPGDGRMRGSDYPN